MIKRKEKVEEEGELTRRQLRLGIMGRRVYVLDLGWGFVNVVAFAALELLALSDPEAGAISHYGSRDNRTDTIYNVVCFQINNISRILFILLVMKTHTELTLQGERNAKPEEEEDDSQLPITRFPFPKYNNNNKRTTMTTRSKSYQPLFYSFMLFFFGFYIESIPSLYIFFFSLPYDWCDEVTLTYYTMSR